MGAKLLGSTSRSGLSVEQVGGNDVYQMLPQLESVLEGLGPEYKRLFAEPVESGRSIDWYVDDAGKVEPLSDMPLEERQKTLQKLGSLLQGLEEYAAKLRAGKSAASKNYADILEKAMVVPGAAPDDRYRYYYSVDGQPVLIGWGFSNGNSDTVKEVQELIKQVANEIKSKAQEVKPEPKPEPEPVPKPAPKPEPKPVPQPAPAPQPAPRSSSMGWLIAVLVGAGLILAGAAAWYFMFKKPEPEQATAPDKSLAFLKGSLNAVGTLVNMTGEKVDLELHFPGEDGKGVVTVKEPNQTCTGTTQASLGEGNTVIFDISPINCPNHDNYEPMTMQCIRGVNTCTAKGKDGRTFQLQLK